MYFIANGNQTTKFARFGHVFMDIKAAIWALMEIWVCAPWTEWSVMLLLLSTEAALDQVTVTASDEFLSLLSLNDAA